uniref:Clathrin-coat assembly protein, putative n=1 Tax=Theileria annulata TaxID=5874 RepID=A0A3B0MM31_THEAN
MTISQFFIISHSGDVLLSRNFRNETTKNVDNFYNYLKENSNIGPIFELEGMLYFYIRRSNLYFVMSTRYITSPSYVMELLNKITNYLKDFIGILNEETIKSNFVLAYEILDEILDYGYIQCISINQLKQKIYNTSTVTTDNIKPMMSNRNMLPSVVSNKSLINPNNKNEIFVDVIEKVTAKLGSDVKTTVEGQIQIKSYLKGSPSIQMYISNNIQFSNNTSRTSNEPELANQPSSNLHLEQFPVHDNKFSVSSINAGSTDRVGSLEYHRDQTYRFQSLEMEDVFENKIVIEDYNLESDVEMVNNVMKFIPKEGEYTILNYKIKNVKMPFDIKTQLVNNTENTVGLSIRVTCNLPINVHSFFLLKCKLPNHVNTINMSVNPKFFQQVSEYKLENNTISWNIKNIQGSSEVVLNSEIVFNNKVNSNQFGPINLIFEVPLYNITNLKVSLTNSQFPNSDKIPKR